GKYPSEMTAEVDDTQELTSAYEAREPLGRLGKPDELDAAIANHVSPASSYMTGQTLVIDGGGGL
ncbi:MAG: hypothetical protein QOH64_1797, partial [Acidimicrobiaceae bacterium]